MVQFNVLILFKKSKKEKYKQFQIPEGEWAKEKKGDQTPCSPGHG